jgi:hypothetical protein
MRNMMRHFAAVAGLFQFLLIRSADAHAVFSSTTITADTTLDEESPTVVFCDTSGGSLTVTLPSATGGDITEQSATNGGTRR